MLKITVTPPATTTVSSGLVPSIAPATLITASVAEPITTMLKTNPQVEGAELRKKAAGLPL